TLAGKRRLEDLWGSGPNDLWAVGSEAPNVSIMHWDGATWSDGPSAIPVRGMLRQVWGSGPNDVWAIGEANAAFVEGVLGTGGTGGLLMHWDGSFWQAVATPDATDALFAIWG